MSKGRGRSTSDKVIHESKNWGGMLLVVFLLFAFAGPILKSCGGSATTGAAGTGAVVGAAGGAAACKTFCNKGGGGGAGGGGGSSKAAKEKEAPTTTAPPADPEPEDEPEETRIRPERTFELAPPRRGGEFRPPAQPGLDWQPVPMPGFVTQ